MDDVLSRPGDVLPASYRFAKRSNRFRIDSECEAFVSLRSVDTIAREIERDGWTDPPVDTLELGCAGNVAGDCFTLYVAGLKDSGRRQRVANQQVQLRAGLI